MPWCPKCKSEYVNGITECVDCKVPLIDELPTEEDVVDITDTEDVPVIEISEEEEDIEKNQKVIPYENYHDKAENFKSSAYTLLLVGCLGIVALVLMNLGILPIQLRGSGQYITYIVMGALFIIFIIVGIRSFQSAKKYADLAIEEDDTTKTIKDWIAENINPEEIKASTADTLSEEMKYFQYTASLKRMINKQFPDLREEYVDNLVEELYSSLFEK